MSNEAHQILDEALMAVVEEAKAEAEVLYTCMVDEKEHGPWEKIYLWKDAIVVGGINRYNQVISHGQELDNNLFFSKMSL